MTRVVAEILDAYLVNQGTSTANGPNSDIRVTAPEPTGFQSAPAGVMTTKGSSGGIADQIGPAPRHAH